MTDLLNSFYPAWIDSLWLVIILILAGKKQRVLSFLFILSGMVMMRLQVEMLGMAGFKYGIIGLLPELSIFLRGLIIYSIVYAGFAVFVKLAPGSRGSLLLVTAITFFMAAFFASTFVMVL